MQFIRRIATFVPFFSPRLRRRFAKRFARLSKSFHVISRRYGASVPALSMRLKSHQVVTLSRSSEGLSSTRLISEPYSLAFLSKKSVITIFISPDLFFFDRKQKTPTAVKQRTIINRGNTSVYRVSSHTASLPAVSGIPVFT